MVLEFLEDHDKGNVQATGTPQRRRQAERQVICSSEVCLLLCFEIHRQGISCFYCSRWCKQRAIIFRAADQRGHSERVRARKSKGETRAALHNKDDDGGRSTQLWLEGRGSVHFSV